MLKLSQFYIYAVYSSPASYSSSYNFICFFSFPVMCCLIISLSFYSFCLLISHLPRPSWCLQTSYWGPLRCPPTECYARICSTLAVCAKMFFKNIFFLHDFFISLFDCKYSSFLTPFLLCFLLFWFTPRFPFLQPSDKHHLSTWFPSHLDYC